MTSFVSPKLAHSSRASHLPAASVVGLSIMPGERRGGWTFRGNGGPAAVTLGNAANKPSGYAICKISDELKFVPGVGAPAIDNGALERHRARCGREFRGHQIWIDPTKGPAAPLIKSRRKASGEPVVIVGMEGVALLLDSKAHPHLASSSALRLSQVEDGRGTKECPTNVIPVSETKVPRIR